ncbi:beta/gamma crystallin-related protein [Cystobacter fuscus]|uniref:beta/gamma crystallin-related protein n=1 Tax=Cystobacter fuscus TaxID=43 RepID=UPI0012DCEEF6|nr:beta/gamma crystallin-related protein [Cystobacter fuscus]
MSSSKSAHLPALPLLFALSVGCGGAFNDAGEVESAQQVVNADADSKSAADVSIQAGAIVIYEHCDYGGESQAFYYPRDINSFYRSLGGDWNDRVSSIRVFGGAARIFEHENWQGSSITVTSDIACLYWSGWNDIASSLEWL